MKNTSTKIHGFRFPERIREMKTLNELKTLACQEIDRRRQELIAFGTDIWKHPEPGYREFRTAQAAAAKLEELGLTVTGGLACTGFRADLDTGRPGPVVALLGEMDSLILPTHPEADPSTGAVHACGHNTHITALTGAAAGLSAAGVPDSCSGKIALIGVPAEESLNPVYAEELRSSGKIRFTSGKAERIRCGVFDDVDIAMMNHSGCSFHVSDFNGHLLKDVIFHGKSAHAASPDGGINAMSAANLALHALALAKDNWTSEPYVRVHGLITHAGDAVNIVPDRVAIPVFPAVFPPAFQPSLLHRVDQIARVGADRQNARLPERLQRGDDGEHLHPVVGRKTEAAGEFLAEIPVFQNGSVAPAARIPAAGTIGVNFNFLHGKGYIVSRNKKNARTFFLPSAHHSGKTRQTRSTTISGSISSRRMRSIPSLIVMVA